MLIQLNDGQDVPADGIREEEVAKDLGHVAQLPNLEPVHRLVGRLENLQEGVDVRAVDLAETLGEQAKELFVGALLGAAIWKKGDQIKNTDNFEKKDTSLSEAAKANQVDFSIDS